MPSPRQKPAVKPSLSDDAVEAKTGKRWKQWFDELDRRADPARAPRLRGLLSESAAPEGVRIPGLTPEERRAYGLAYARTAAARARGERGRADRRLAGALRTGGGTLRDFRDRGEFWVVQWTDREGRSRTSAIAKSDLTVMSAGVCLAGGDRTFDLQSLVGVVQGSWE